MPSAITSIVRAALRRPGDRLNVLLAPPAKPFDDALYHNRHDFYALASSRAFPRDRVTRLSFVNHFSLPADLDVDVVVSSHEPAPMKLASTVAGSLHCPLVCVFQQPPEPTWPERFRDHIRGKGGNFNVFPNWALARAWGWESEPSVRIVPPGDAVAWNSVLGATL